MNDEFRDGVRQVIQATVEGTPRHELVLTIGRTPSYLLDIGFPELPLTIKGSTIDKAHFDHGITHRVLERLGELLAQPRALYRSATVVGTAVVVTLVLKDGKPVLVPLHARRMVGRSSVNLVASVYAKDVDVESRWRAEGLLVRHWPRTGK